MQQEAVIRIKVLALLTVLAGSAFAQTTKPTTKYDWSTPLAASTSLSKAGEQHEQFIAYHAATDAERALLREFADLGAASAELDKACLDRFKRGLPKSPMENGNHDEAVVNGDEAFVYIGGKQSGLRTRWIRVNGEWKVPMADILRVHLTSYKTLQNAIEKKQSWTKQLRQVSDEVRAGKYASPEAVDEKLGDLAVVDDTPSTQPAK